MFHYYSFSSPPRSQMMMNATISVTTLRTTLLQSNGFRRAVEARYSVTEVKGTNCLTGLDVAAEVAEQDPFRDQVTAGPSYATQQA